MIRFKCPQCSKTLQVGPEHAGKTIKCPCGTQIKAPAGQVAAPKPTPQPAVAQANKAATTTTVCSTCGKTLRVPVSSVGKLLKCNCGSTFRMGGAPATSPVQEAPMGIPQPAAPQPMAAPIPQPVLDDPWADIESTPAPAPIFKSAEPQQRSKPNPHLESARREMERSGGRSSAKRSGGVNMGSVITGLLMMVGAAVWFIGGLVAGIIFFYPPVLFIIGLITFVGGLFGGGGD